MPKKVNLADVEVREFEPLPRGRYTAVLNKFEFTEDASGEDLLKVQWKVTEGEYQDRVIFDQYSLVSTALWSFKRDMAVLGVDSDLLNAKAIDPEEVIAQAMNAEALISVKVDTKYNNNKVTKVAELEGAFA